MSCLVAPSSGLAKGVNFSFWALYLRRDDKRSKDSTYQNCCFFQADAPSRIPTCAESKQHAARGFKSEFIKGSSIVCLYMDQTLFMGGSVRYESKMN